ncbi:MAG: dimethylsulfonioproprionate lyase family protein [Pseudomonadota bacterium]
MKLETIQREILKSIVGFGLSNSDASVERFKPSIRDWGDQWIRVEPRFLPAAESLSLAIPNALDTLRPLIELFDHYKHSLYWEQSYTRQDGYFPDEMLDYYGFAEIIGARGPFVSEKLRAGVGIYPPGAIYPRHQHQAEEIYILLAGSATYEIGDREKELHHPGDVIFIESNTPHGFVNGDEAIIVYYLWQAGDLRQISTFD